MLPHAVQWVTVGQEKGQAGANRPNQFDTGARSACASWRQQMKGFEWARSIREAQLLEEILLNAGKRRSFDICCLLAGYSLLDSFFRYNLHASFLCSLDLDRRFFYAVHRRGEFCSALYY